MNQADVTEPIYMYSLVDKYRVKSLEIKRIAINIDTIENNINIKTKEGLSIKGDSLFFIEVYPLGGLNIGNFSLKIMALNSDSFLVVKNDTSFYEKKQDDGFVGGLSEITDRRDFSFLDFLNDNYYHDSNNVVIISLLNNNGKKILKKSWEADVLDINRNIEMYIYKKKKEINPNLYNGLIEEYIENENQYLIP